MAVTKFGAWLLTGSSSMLAERIDFVADTGNHAFIPLPNPITTQETP